MSATIATFNAASARAYDFKFARDRLADLKAGDASPLDIACAQDELNKAEHAMRRAIAAHTARR